ncbi:hypothetical protein OIO90_004424 [Microbotryomycetes sp. JL221]|nr:hypothetical protein OIO90_004424 [Microbotryomycetes sp. JL221]
MPRPQEIVIAMNKAVDEAGRDKRLRIRVTIDKSARPLAQAFPLDLMPSFPVRLVFDDRPTDYSDPFLRYKTTRRTVYDQTRERRGATLHPSDDDNAPPFDVIMYNERGQVTETTIANLGFKLRREDSVWSTPATECGLLQGVQRAELLDTGMLVEAVVTVEDVHKACKDNTLQIICFNGVRGTFKAELIRS